MFDQKQAEYQHHCELTGEVSTFYGFIKFGKWSLDMMAMLLRYLRCSREYDWGPCIEGLVLFPGQIEVGIRKGVIEVD